MNKKILLLVIVVICLVAICIMIFSLSKSLNDVATFTPPPFEQSAIQGVLDVPADLEYSEYVGLTQKQLSQLENDNANPSLRTLKHLANSMDMSIKLEFVPNIHR